MKHFCPMCGEQWNEDRCATCGWKEPPRFTPEQWAKLQKASGLWDEPVDDGDTLTGRCPECAEEK